jgi:hypothetical protein
MAGDDHATSRQIWYDLRRSSTVHGIRRKAGVCQANPDISNGTWGATGCGADSLAAYAGYGERREFPLSCDHVARLSVGSKWFEQIGEWTASLVTPAMIIWT